MAPKGGFAKINASFCFLFITQSPSVYVLTVVFIWLRGIWWVDSGKRKKTRKACWKDRIMIHEWAKSARWARKWNWIRCCNEDRSVVFLLSKCKQSKVSFRRDEICLCSMHSIPFWSASRSEISNLNANKSQRLLFILPTRTKFSFTSRGSAVESMQTKSLCDH